MKAKTNLFYVVLWVLLALCGPAWGQWTEPVPVTEVNTDSAEEWSPFLSFNGLTLYFARVRSDSFYYGRIFEATREVPYGQFTSVKEVTGTLNSSTGHVLCPWVSPDNLRMYYHNERGGRFTLKVSERTSIYDPWPEGISISELNVLGDRLQAPKLTADELIIFFDAYEIPGGQGGYDIWMATRPDRDSLFSEVINLEEINTASSEGTPFVTPDGLILVFHSNRNGQYQLFRATRGSLTEPFGNIEHLSAFDIPEGGSFHPCLSSNGSKLYFMRQQGEDRSSRDIWVSYNPYELAIIRIEDAIAEKLEALESIVAALEKEWAAIEALNELLDRGEFDDLIRPDMLRAKSKIHKAIVGEKIAARKLKETIRDLEIALAILHGEAPPQNWPEKQTQVNDAVIWADINTDGVVDFRDFAVLANYWLEYQRAK